MSGPLPLPDSRGCIDHFETTPCRTDNDVKGICTTKEVRTPDFSKPGPPTFSMVGTRICVATASPRTWGDFAQGAVVALIIFAMVIYRVLRRRSLADYGS